MLFSWFFCLVVYPSPVAFLDTFLVPVVAAFCMLPRRMAIHIPHPRQCCLDGMTKQMAQGDKGRHFLTHLPDKK